MTFLEQVMNTDYMKGIKSRFVNSGNEEYWLKFNKSFEEIFKSYFAEESIEYVLAKLNIPKEKPSFVVEELFKKLNIKTSGT